MQVQEHDVPLEPAAGQHRVHLRERGTVRHPALHPLGHEQNPQPPPQRDHSGGRQQQQR